MHIRPATHADLSSLATIGALAFKDDGLLQWLYPGGVEHPEDFRGVFLHRLHERMATPGIVIMVMETDEDDADWDGTGRIVAYTNWERRGDDGVAKRWWTGGWMDFINRTLLGLKGEYLKLSGTNCCMSRSNMGLFEASMTARFDNLSSYWLLRVLAVSPALQRRGIGGRLLRWGLDVAQSEGVPVTLEATPQGQGLYLQNGFRKFGEIEEPGMKEPGPLFIWEPKGLEGLWGTQDVPGERR
ncbi:MAG: hypothetical protein M1838_004152 [Thelocarpon superellum]|nr:MAG: hypothetical protein M1838_004152 [Thelocarpon superellum]